MAFRILLVTQLSSDFVKATQVVERPLTQPKDDQVLVKNFYTGINATDVNFSAGRYFAEEDIPFSIGFEGLGLVESIGCNVTGFTVGESVLWFGNGGGYAEYIYATVDQLIKVPSVDPIYLAIPANGLTATIGLDKAGRMKKGEKVFVTAAAGGTGQIAVQWAKLKGCHVIGMTSSEEKCNHLKSIECDCVINYRQSNVSDTLTKLYPEGVDVVWETIGGETMAMLIDHLAIHGRMVVAGGTSGYKGEGYPSSNLEDMPLKVKNRSLSINGFALYKFREHFDEYTQQLVQLISSRKIKVKVDMGESTAEGHFEGIASVPRAVEYLHTGKSCGKVVVRLQ